MSNEYEIEKLTDIAKLDDDQIDRLCAELPAVLKYAKSVDALFQASCEALGVAVHEMEILSPLKWIDDGKNDVTVSITNGDESLMQFEVTAKEEAQGDE